MFRSLNVKLTLGFLVVGLVGVFIVVGLVGTALVRNFEPVLAGRDIDFINRLALFYEANDSWDGLDTVFNMRQGRMPGGRGPDRGFVLLDARGRIIVGADRFPVGERVPWLTRMRAIPVEVDGQTVGRVLIGPLLQAQFPDSPELRFLGQMQRALFISAGAATVLALLVGVALARSLTQPLREMTGAARAIARGDLDQAVPVRSQDELGELAHAFNQMSRDLAQATALRRQMTSDIAHDLRTPLTVILGYAEMLRQGDIAPDQAVFDVVHDEAQQLNRLVDDLRTLARADAGELSLMREHVAAATLLRRSQVAFAALAEQQSIALELGHVDDVTVWADPARVDQVLDNLVSNALRHTPAGGRVTLSAVAAGPAVRFAVADNGPGIAAADLPYIFERSYRGNAARSGGESGLGLAIARSLVEAHGGAIEVASTAGAGATFTFTLPRGP